MWACSANCSTGFALGALEDGIGQPFTTISPAEPSSSVTSTSLSTSTTVESTATSTESIPATSTIPSDLLNITSTAVPAPLPPIQSPTNPSSELSTGAKIGLGTGVSLGVNIIACLITVVFYLRRRNLRSLNEHQPGARPNIPMHQSEGLEVANDYTPHLYQLKHDYNRPPNYSEHLSRSSKPVFHEGTTYELPAHS